MQHTIERSEDGFHCTVCNWDWLSKPNPNKILCPGVQRYGAHPAHLKTWAELHKAGLVATGPKRGCQWNGHEWYWYYDPAETTPRLAEDIAREWELKEVHAKRRRTCCVCARTFPKVNDLDDGPEGRLCSQCFDQILTEEHEREVAILQNARRESISWARALQAAELWSWVVLDTETTGLRGEIIEIAILRPDGLILLNTRIKPTCRVEQGAFAVHGISDAELADAPTFPEVYAQIAAVLTGRKIVIYNREFDEGRLAADCRRHDLQSVVTEEHSITCAMLQYAAFCGDWNEYRQDFRWQRLPGGGHSAVSDCQATLALIAKMAQGK